MGGRVVEVTFLSGQVGTHLVPWQPDSARGTLEQHLAEWSFGGGRLLAEVGSE